MSDESSCAIGSALTRIEAAMLDRLKRERFIMWLDVRSTETATLNRLVAKGWAFYDKTNRVWELREFMISTGD